MNELIDYLKQYSEYCDGKKAVQLFENDILNLKNPFLSLHFCRLFQYSGANIKAHQDIIIKSGDASICLDFARDILGADVDSLGKIVSATNNSSLCFEFISEVRRSDFDDYENVILEERNPYLSYRFAKDIKGANIKAHEKIVIESKDAKLCCDFAMDIKGADIKALSDVIIESKDLDENLRFAQWYKCPNKASHIQVILQSGNNGISLERIKEDDYYFSPKLVSSSELEDGIKNQILILK